MIDDTTSALAVFLVSGHIGNGKECFGGVHIGIDAAIGVKLGEFRVPSIDGQTDLVIPEMLVVGCQSLFEQLVRVRAADKLGGSGGKNHESVGVADLACFMGGAVCGNGRIPSAVFIVMQRTAQAGDGLVNQFCGARLAVQEPQGIHVRHAAGDPRVDVLGQIRIAGIVQPVGSHPAGRGNCVRNAGARWFPPRAGHGFLRSRTRRLRESKCRSSIKSFLDVVCCDVITRLMY